MRLGIARLCLDCEEVHEANLCPVCGSETFAFLKRWVKPVAALPHTKPRPDQNLVAPERVEHVQDYEQLLNPGRERSLKSRLITRGALGLALVGMARLLLRAGNGAQQRVPDHKKDSTLQPGA